MSGIWGVSTAALIALFLLGGGRGWALDHDNLDAGRPLQIEDAYPVAKGEIAIEAGLEAADRRGAGARVAVTPQVVFGAAYNTQVELGGLIASESTGVATDREGGARLGALYNFNTETLSVPAMAIKAELEVVGGAQPRGVDASAAAIVTRTFGRWRTHLNAQYTLSGSSAAGERRGRYGGAVGANYPLGYPLRFRDTLIVDAFIRQAGAPDDPNTTGLELGIRHQLTPRVVVDAGIGAELTGPDDRSPVFVIVGVSAGF